MLVREWFGAHAERRSRSATVVLRLVTAICLGALAIACASHAAGPEAEPPDSAALTAIRGRAGPWVVTGFRIGRFALKRLRLPHGSIVLDVASRAARGAILVYRRRCCCDRSQLRPAECEPVARATVTSGITPQRYANVPRAQLLLLPAGIFRERKRSAAERILQELLCERRTQVEPTRLQAPGHAFAIGHAYSHAAVSCLRA